MIQADWSTSWPSQFPSQLYQILPSLPEIATLRLSKWRSTAGPGFPRASSDMSKWVLFLLSECLLPHLENGQAGQVLRGPFSDKLSLWTWGSLCCFVFFSSHGRTLMKHGKGNTSPSPLEIPSHSDSYQKRSPWQTPEPGCVRTKDLQGTSDTHTMLTC